MNVVKRVLLGVGATAVAAGVVVGGWQANWWLQANAVNHQNHIQHESYNFQTAQLTEMNSDMVQIAGLDTQIQQEPQNASVLLTQKQALEQQFCSDYGQTNSINLPANIKTFAGEACAVPAA